MHRNLIVTSCLATLYGCSYTAPDDESNAGTSSIAEADIRTYVYECANDFNFIARTEPGKVWLFLPGKTIDLGQVEAASGTKYTSKSYTFWNTGDEARLETEARIHADCRNNRARAIWEHAKLNGVDFRALGNEPGWHIEISNKRDILLVTDYGQRSYRFSSSTIKSEPHGKTTIYNASHNDDLVEVVITAAPCQDSMSGESFSASVSVLINDRRLTGCGRPLH